MNEKETAHKGFSKINTLFISIRATLLKRYLRAYNKDVASNKVVTLRSVQSRIANIFCVMLLANNKNQQLQIPLIILRSAFNVLHSMLVCYVISMNILYMYNSVFA